MDARLAQAISEVLGNGGNEQLLSGVLNSAAAGQAVKRRLLKRAQTLTASTGAPISGLRGIARAKAAISALDNGAKSAGGGGIQGGSKVLKTSAIKVELAVLGLTGALVVGRIAVRYVQLVRADQKCAASDETSDE